MINDCESPDFSRGMGIHVDWAGDEGCFLFCVPKGSEKSKRHEQIEYEEIMGYNLNIWFS